MQEGGRQLPDRQASVAAWLASCKVLLEGCTGCHGGSRVLEVRSTDTRAEASALWLAAMGLGVRRFLRAAGGLALLFGGRGGGGGGGTYTTPISPFVICLVRFRLTVLCWRSRRSKASRDRPADGHGRETERPVRRHTSIVVSHTSQTGRSLTKTLNIYRTFEGNF